MRRYEGCYYTRLESYYIIFYFEADWSRIRPLPSTTLISNSPASVYNLCIHGEYFNTGYIPDDAIRTMLPHLSPLTNTRLFCINLGLAQTECEIIVTQFEDIEDQKLKILTKWLDIARRTWKDFIHPFVMLKYCVKANELAKEHSVHFEDEVILSKCPDINNHVEL